ncbi:hypothetical protein SK128_003715 [Halocaridina rubra]|uniref:Uncharacterized protein n=1 Tax=Halocaridina rubra TaxID=373956 RepID=A0AAN9AHF2_HALRR
MGRKPHLEPTYHKNVFRIRKKNITCREVMYFHYTLSILAASYETQGASVCFLFFLTISGVELKTSRLQ